MANVLSNDKKVAVITALVEGCSVRSTSRMTGVAKGTILRLLADIGKACADYQDRVIRNIPSQRVQIDEIWNFCYAKQKNVTPEIAAKIPGAGDVWTFVAIDADTKLVIGSMVGSRNVDSAAPFMEDVAGRLSNRVQLTTDSHKMYLVATKRAFGNDIDYAQLLKVYGGSIEGRYSPAICLRTKKTGIIGMPNPEHVSTSYIERQNLNMRMNMRRFTRLTNAFSKKIENLAYSVALFHMHYNFVRIHQTLRITPAMAAGVSSHLWSIQEIVALLDAPKIQLAA